MKSSKKYIFTIAATLLACIVAAIFLMNRSVAKHTDTLPFKSSRHYSKSKKHEKVEHSTKQISKEAIALKEELHNRILTKGGDGNEEALIHEFCRALTLETLPYYLEMLKLFDEGTYAYYIPARINYSIHARWIQLDAKAALSSARTKWDAMPEGYFNILLHSWGETQPEAALNFYYELKADPTASITELLSLLKSTALNNLQVNAQELSSFPESKEKRLTIQNLLNKIVADSNISDEKIKEWVNAFKDPDLSNRYTLLSLQQLAKKSPKDAFVNADALNIDSDLRKTYSVSFFHEWSSKEPQEALDWLSDAKHLPVEEAQKYYSILIKDWSNLDLEKTISWLEKTTNSGEYDEAISGIILKIKNNDEIKARKLIEKIVDVTTRNNLLKNLEHNNLGEVNSN